MTITTTLNDFNVVSATRSELTRVPEKWTGITYTTDSYFWPCRLKPYTVWCNGLIWLYTENEIQAKIGLTNAKFGLQSMFKEYN